MPGRIVVVSGPSGSGKSSLIRRALECPGVRARLSVSATTRPPRPGEVHGVHYHFLDRPAFEAAIARGEFLEWAEFAGELYGTPCSEIAHAESDQICLILEIEVCGALQVQKKIPSARLIWVDVPSLEVLEARLRSRGSDSEASIARRLERAQWEITQACHYHHHILNDDLDLAVHELAALFQTEGCGGTTDDAG